MRGRSIFVAILIAAFLTRTAYLDTYPPGIHGDEALTGLRALHIFENGFIGFFDNEHAYGQWALAEYLTVPFVKLIKDDFYSIRLPMGIAGSVGMILFYLILKRLTGSSLVALLGFAYQLVFFPHFHLSRVAITPVLSDTANLAGLYFFLSGKPFVSGVMFSIGSISYASGLFTPLAFFGAYFLITRKVDLRLLLPFIVITSSVYAFEFFEGRLTGRAKSVFDFEQVNSRLESIRKYVSSIFSEGYFDASDGTGGERIYSLIELLCFSFGFLLALKRKNVNQLVLFLTATGILFLSLYTALSTDHGFFRRSINAFSLLNLFLFSNIALIQDRVAKVMYKIVLTVALVNQALSCVRQAQSEPVSWVFAHELTQIRDLINKYSRNIETVGFKSGRWSIRYETNKWFYRDFSNFESFEDIKTKPARRYDLTIFDDPALLKYFRAGNYRCRKLNKFFRYCRSRYTQVEARTSR